MEDVGINTGKEKATNPEHGPMTMAGPNEAETGKCPLNDAIPLSDIKEEEITPTAKSNYVESTSASLHTILEDSAQHVYEPIPSSYDQSHGAESSEALILPLTQSGHVTSSHEIVQSSTTNPGDEFVLAAEPQKDIFNLQPLVPEEGQSEASTITFKQESDF